MFDDGTIMLRILEILQEAGESHPMNIGEIGESLQYRIKGKVDDEKIRDYLEILKNCDYGLEEDDGIYYIPDMKMDRSDLQTLADVVSESKTLPEGRQKRLVKKIRHLEAVLN